MRYYSTRDYKLEVNSIDAIIQGISKDGGLFLPTDYLQLDLNKHLNDTYQELAFHILSYYFDEFDHSSLKEAINNAYSKFDNKDVTPIVKVNDNYLLELWHGPTCAFKDIALTLLPQLLSLALQNKPNSLDSLVLVATSGDTGKAALEGFKNVNKTKIMVFYPSDGVSETQKLQMQTTTGNNVKVVAVKGNFDDCQKAVKTAMTSCELQTYLSNYNLSFSSANSINIARLLPQVVYYFYTYFQLVKQDEIKLNHQVNFCVPTGNFGNILAGYIASLMGLPINKLIMASNTNNILSDFINTGTYDIHRTFYKTYSPSMDIIVSSNLERLLSLEINDDKEIINIQQNLKDNGKFTITSDIKDKINEIFIGGYCNDKDTLDTISNVFNHYHYLLDPHTAVAYKVLKEKKEDTPSIILSTASPYKFEEAIKQALNINDDISSYTNTIRPLPLCNLKDKPILHNITIENDEIINYIKENVKTW